MSPNTVAQLMIVGCAFAFMIEGSSGFGAPAAIAVPLLVSLGLVAILALIPLLAHDLVTGLLGLLFCLK